MLYHDALQQLRSDQCRMAGRLINKKLSEQQIAYFPWVLHGPHIKQEIRGATVTERARCLAPMGTGYKKKTR
jgi:hypothetical protein